MSRVVLVPQSSVAEPRAYPELADKRVLISNASYGIGPIVSHAFAEQGCRLVLQCGGTQGRAQKLAQELTGSAAAIRVFPFSLHDADCGERLADAALRAFNGIDIVVNQIAVEPQSLLQAMTADDFEVAISEALSAQVSACDVVVSRLQMTGRGGLILHLAHLPENDMSAAFDIVTRLSLEALTRGQARDLADDNVQVNAIAASGVLDDGELEDVAEVALQLANERNHWLNGQVLTIGEGI